MRHHSTHMHVAENCLQGPHERSTWHLVSPEAAPAPARACAQGWQAAAHTMHTFQHFNHMRPRWTSGGRISCPCTSHGHAWGSVQLQQLPACAGTAPSTPYPPGTPAALTGNGGPSPLAAQRPLSSPQQGQTWLPKEMCACTRQQPTAGPAQQHLDATV
jgi:hypothetical protein